MITVCPYCGPESLAYAGRIISVVCSSCKIRLNSEPDIRDRKTTKEGV